MAVPTSPTLDTLCTEALKKCGYSGTAVTDRLTRAKDEWAEEIKDDIFNLFRANRIRSLEITSMLVCTIGLGRYSDPEEASDMSMIVLDGTITGIAQAGALNSITLAASETIEEGKIKGKEILIPSGAGIASISQCIAYSTSTKIATVSPNFNTSPASGSGYQIIESYTPIQKRASWEYDTIQSPTLLGKPEFYYPKGDQDYGEFYLYKVPDKAYGIRQRWYADLTRIDLASTHMATLLRKWRNLWVYGVAWKAFEAMPDMERARLAQAKYERERTIILSREIPGYDVSTLQQTVSDY